MKEQNVYDRIRNRTKPETRRYVHKNLMVMAEISRLMKAKGWSQKDLAKKMGKTESEISKWMSGLHNLTLKSVAKLEVVLDASLLEVPQSAQKYSQSIQYITFVVEKPFSELQLERTKKEKNAEFIDVQHLSEPFAA